MDNAETLNENPAIQVGGVKPPHITADLLVGACSDQVRLFRRLYPDGVDISVEACLAVADQFDWEWAAEYLLSQPARAEYDRAQQAAWAAYQRARHAAWWAEYEKPAFAEYKRVERPARAEQAALAEYQRVRRAAWAEYERGCARGFAEAALAHGLSEALRAEAVSA